MDALIDLRRFRLRIINGLSYLHEEVIEEILLRLPVKSLTRFKCVSKSWCSVINDKRFIKAHIKKSSANPSFINHKVIGNVDFVQECSLLSLLHEPSPITPVEYDYPTYSNEASDFIGCCDGLVCIIICGKDFILWNPATKEFNLLPSIIPDDVQLVMYGFGYDKLSDDYKVFGLLRGNNWVVAKVYSLKTNSWRIVNTNIPVKIDPLFLECGKFVCGKLHWTMMTVAEPKMKCDICLFDLESECYGSLELPSRAVGDFVPYVGAVEGSLCLVCDYVTPRYFDVWITKEYNVQDSWHKMATLPYPMPCNAIFLDPLFVGGNGEILFACEGSFVVYHPREARFSHPRLVDSVDLFGVHVYVESLVSPVPAVQTPRTTEEMMKLQQIDESQFE